MEFFLGMVALMVMVVILAFLLIFFCLMPYIKEITRYFILYFTYLKIFDNFMNCDVGMFKEIYIEVFYLNVIKQLQRFVKFGTTIFSLGQTMGLTGRKIIFFMFRYEYS